MLFSDNRAPFEPNSCEMVAYECESFEEYRRGRCNFCGKYNERCKILGFGWQTREAYNDIVTTSSHEKRKYYISTRPAPEICATGYRITMKLLSKYYAYEGNIFVRLRIGRELTYLRMNHADTINGYYSTHFTSRVLPNGDLQLIVLGSDIPLDVYEPEMIARLTSHGDDT